MKIYPRLLTDRLLLREFELSDAPVVQKLAGAVEVAEMTLNIPHPYEAGMAESWIKTHHQHYSSGSELVFAMERRSDNQLIGAIGQIITQRFNRAELGYWVGKPFWGRGYATEAAREMLRYSFQVLKLNRVHASHMTRNPASGKVMQKIGMQLEGVLRQHALKWDQFVDMAVYGILAEQWHRIDGA